MSKKIPVEPDPIIAEITRVKNAMLEQECRHAEEQEISDNTINGFFDGLKNVFSRENPITLILPMRVMPNAFYLYEGKLYVGLKRGVVTEENFSEMLEPDELPEEV